MFEYIDSNSKVAQNINNYHIEEHKSTSCTSATEMRLNFSSIPYGSLDYDMGPEPPKESTNFNIDHAPSSLPEADQTNSTLLPIKQPQKKKQKKNEPKKITPDRVYKIIFIGDAGVGKTTFIHQFCHNSFMPNFGSTIGIDFQVKTIAVEGKRIALQLWDTSGQERFQSLTMQYYRKVDGIVVLYDVTNETSFKNVRNWIHQVAQITGEQVMMMVVGNKIDLCETSDRFREVTTENGILIANECGALFYEGSAKNGHSVEESIKTFSRLLAKKEDEVVKGSIKLIKNTKIEKNCCHH